MWWFPTKTLWKRRKLPSVLRGNPIRAKHRCSPLLQHSLLVYFVSQKAAIARWKSGAQSHRGRLLVVPPSIPFALIERARFVIYEHPREVELDDWLTATERHERSVAWRRTEADKAIPTALLIYKSYPVTITVFHFFTECLRNNGSCNSSWDNFNNMRIKDIHIKLKKTAK